VVQRGDRRRKLKSVLTDLDELTSHDLLDLDAIAAALDHEPPRALDTPLQPRGYRLLARIPRLPSSVVDKLVSRFNTLSRILDASEEELMNIEGIGEARASSIKEGLTQLAATTAWDR
jgi:diadenylate cyclase